MTAKLTMALAVSALTAAGSVLAAPTEARTLRDFFVHSTAMSLGRGDSVIGASGGIDGLHGVPVTVVLARSECHRFQPNRVFFTVAHPVTTDILNVTFETASGRVLARERLQIEGNERSGDPD